MEETVKEIIMVGFYVGGKRIHEGGTFRVLLRK